VLADGEGSGELTRRTGDTTDCDLLAPGDPHTPEDSGSTANRGYSRPRLRP